MTTSAPTVSRRLRGLVTTVLLLLVLVGAAGTTGLAVTARTHAAELASQRLDGATTRMLLAVTNAETGVRGYRLSQDRSFLEPYATARQEFEAQAGAALEAADDPEVSALVERQRSIARTWFTDYADPVAAMPAGSVEVSPALTVLNKQTVDSFREANTELSDLAEVRLDRAQRTDAIARTTALVVSVAAPLVALLVAVVSVRRTRRALVRPLGAVVRVLERLRAGDRAVRADEASGPLEVRAVARTVNELAEAAEHLRHRQVATARLQRLAAEIGRGIREQVVAEDSVAVAVTRLGETLEVDGAHVLLLEDGVLGGIAHRWSPSAGSAPRDAAGNDPEPDTSPWTTAARVRQLCAAGSPLVVTDLASLGRRRQDLTELTRRTGATAALLLPLGSGRGALGVLCLTTGAGPRRWSAAEVALATSVAADLAISLVQVRVSAQQRDLVEQLRELDRAKTDFLATVSHELRTPLTSIAGYVEMVRDGDAGELPAEADVMLAVVERNTARLQGLIEDLLTLSRIESGAFRVSLGDVPVADVVTQVGGCLRPAAEGAGVELVVEAGDPATVVHGDAVQVERVLMNLLSNAVKFTPAGGRVALRAGAADGWAVIDVTDTGIGIPEEEQGGLFTRFFRASNATERAIPGTGLGLTIVRSIVEHHGGSLEVRSAVGEGTTATVRLPLRARDAAPGAVGDDARTATAAGARS